MGVDTRFGSVLNLVGRNLIWFYMLVRQMVECQVFTVPEAGRKLGISRNSAYDAVRRGEIPSIRIGRRLLVPIVALERMLNSAGQYGGDEAPSEAPRAG